MKRGLRLRPPLFDPELAARLLVRETSPMKRGLRPSWWMKLLGIAIPVRETSPMKRGLRQA